MFGTATASNHKTPSYNREFTPSNIYFMGRDTRIMRVLVLLALLAVPVVNAQATNLPDLSTATQATALPSDSTSGGTTGQTTATSAESTTGDSTTRGTTQTSATSATTGQMTSASTTGATSEQTSLTATFSTTGGSHTGTSTGVGGLLSNLPTIAGAGIPTIVIPYTANAPFMQKSTLPEGTVFIAVGAVLAFLGACVLLWRGLVAWSINRSVRRAANASVRGGLEKSSTWASGKSTYYKEYEAGSSMSLDALTSAGKPIRSAHFQDEKSRHSAAPPAGLFFSPTAQASNRASSIHMGSEHRGSGYMPAGYYASPSATEPAGGRGSVALGSSLAPYARQSMVDPSPPGSPLPNSRSTNNVRSVYGGAGITSRDGLRAHDSLARPSRENLRTASRDGYGSRPGSHMYAHPSSSSLAVGPGLAARSSSEHLAGQRAPSAVLDELFENHGHGPRERF